MVMVVLTWLTWLQSTTEVGNGSEVFSNPDEVTAQSSKETRLYTLAEGQESKWLNLAMTFLFWTIYFSQYFEKWTIGENDIQKKQYNEKIYNFYSYPESIWIPRNFCA